MVDTGVGLLPAWTQLSAFVIPVVDEETEAERSYKESSCLVLGELLQV